MKQLPVPESLSPFVKEILFLEETQEEDIHSFPFYADGFAGIVYSKSKHPFHIFPQDKSLPCFYLYGQTIQPIRLEIKGAFQLYAVRIFPFTLRLLLGVDPKTLNDDCFDLLQLKKLDSKSYIDQLEKTEVEKDIIEILQAYFFALLKHASINPNLCVTLATNMIIHSAGQKSIQDIRKKLAVSERTLERHFLKETGLRPKQFAKIIQFSTSMKKITEKDYLKLTDVGFDSGYADQSHFIRNFKRYSGMTPKEYLKEIQEL